MAQKRRANGEGSIRQRTDGRWLATLTVGIQADGKPKKVFRYAKTQKEALVKLNALKLELGMGIDYEGGTVTVSDWCYTWLNTYKKQLAPTTRTSYLTNIRTHIDTHIGGIAINKLTTQQIQFMLDNIYDDGQNSRSLVIKVLNVLNGALHKAVALGKLQRNPCTGVALPKDDTKDARAFTLNEQKAFVQTLQQETLQTRVMFMTYLYTGARLGELAPLEWQDVVLAERYIDINKKAAIIHDYYATGKKTVQEVQGFCKTKSSTRTIVITPRLVDLLTELKAQQQQQVVFLGQEWSDSNLVFPTSNGTVPYTRNIQEKFERIAKLAQIANVTTHCLRHTYATRLFEADVDVKAISQQLGHKTVNTTYNIYIHLFAEKRIKEIDKLSAIDDIA